MSKNGQEPYFLQEIQEQPKVISNTLSQYLKPNYQLSMKISKQPVGDIDLSKIKKAYITACGTSYHAALSARYIFEELASIPTLVEPASECGRHQLLVDKDTLAIAISQSGCSQDTLAALQLAASRDAFTLAVSNDPESPLVAAAEGHLLTLAGKTQSKSSTKAFTTQLLVLSLLGLRLAQARNCLTKERWKSEFEAVSRIHEYTRFALDKAAKGPTLSSIENGTAQNVPGNGSAASSPENWPHLVAADLGAAAKMADTGAIRSLIENASPLAPIVELLKNHSSCFILAKGHLWPMALEGALKLKEVAKIHAEGYLVGEFGHGPLALANETTPVIIFSFGDEDNHNDMPLASALKERKCPLILISEEGPNEDKALRSMADHFLPLPIVPSWIRPMVAVIPLQLLAFELGIAKNMDVDNPGGTLSSEIHSHGPVAFNGKKANGHSLFVSK
ncbi:MAG: SIS domain-containing protein [Deltaproteobacteria bacterium]|nr:SIS domain-containing protein [Deltaproteobacteria bacterium]